MAAGDTYAGPYFAEGQVAGTGSAIPIVCGFKPASVDVFNSTRMVKLEWTRTMGDGYGYKAGSGGTPNQVFTGSDIKGSANTNSENSDAASLPTNGALLKAADTFATYTSPVSSISEPDVARNIGIFITNDSGGALNLYEGTTTFTITGTYRGAAQVETVTFTSTAGNKSVANNKYRYKYGSKPFDTVTTVAYDNAPASTLKLSVGVGSKIGLPNPIQGAVEASVTKITKNAADFPVSGTVDTTNNTVNLGTLADGDDFQIVYLTSGSTPGLITSGGITRTLNGFQIGTDTDVNVSTNTIYWRAWRY